jgi:dipeptide transport system substrate-binding protein
MRNRRNDLLRVFRWLIIGIALISLAAILGCGDDASPSPTAAAEPGLTAQDVQSALQAALAAAATPAPEPGLSAADVQAAIAAARAAAATPAAIPTSTSSPTSMVEPQGRLSVGIAGSIPSGFVLKLQSYLQGKLDSMLTHEPMFAINLEGEILPLLVETWGIDSSGLEYTFNLQDGARWQQGNGNWGMFDADDFIFSIESAGAPGSSHGWAGTVRRLFSCDGCNLTKVDNLTVRLNRPSPSAEVTYLGNAPNGLAFHSKKHFDAVGEEQALHESVGTGPWELVELKSGQFRRHKAVTDHWRKTPEFDELMWWDVSEESTRVANFLTGLIDTGQFTLTSIQEIKSVNDSDIKFMTFPGRIAKWVNLYGGQYNTDDPAHQPSASGDPARVPLGDNAYDCSLPWVSCDRNTNSADWAKARNVRLAMNLSIDRQSIVNNLAYGSGRPDYLLNWGGYDARAAQFGLDELKYDFEPARARQLLAEAGHPDGFEVDMIIYPGFPAGASELSQTICTMWLDVDIRCDTGIKPYFSHRPTLVNRTAKGVAGFTGPTPAPEPLLQTGLYYSSLGSFNFGWEHPFFQALATEAASLIDPEARWAKMAEMNKWMFDEAMAIPVIAEDIVWPVGPNIDTWTPLGSYLDWLSNWEYVRHRK